MWRNIQELPRANGIYYGFIYKIREISKLRIISYTTSLGLGRDTCQQAGGWLERKK